MDHDPRVKRPRLDDDSLEGLSKGGIVADLDPSIWTRVFPYLPPIDLISVSRCHPLLRSLVDQFMVSGTHILIDDKFVRKFPIVKNQEQYRRIGEHKTSLSVSNLSQIQAQNLFKKHFGNITKLTLIDMTILDGECSSLPSTLHSLALSNCLIDRKLLTSWLDQLKDTLQSLHVLRSRLSVATDLRVISKRKRYMSVYNNPEMLLPSVREFAWEWDGTDYGRDIYVLLYKCMPKMESLTLKMCGTKNWAEPTHLCLPPDTTNLRRLEFDTNFTFGCWMGHLPTVEELIIRKMPPSMYRLFRDSPIKRFECHTYESSYYESAQKCLDSWKQLEYLKMSCDWHQVEKLEAKIRKLERIKGWDLTFCAPTEGYNLVHSLNEYCLQHIVSYLSRGERGCLASAHPSLNWIRLYPWFQLDWDICNEYFDRATSSFRSEFVEKAKAATQVEVNLNSIFGERQFYDVIGYFKNIKRMKWIDPRMVGTKKVKLIPFLEDLTIELRDADKMAKKFYNALFKHLAPKLQRLRIIADLNNFTVMLPLTNLRGLTLTAAGRMEGLSQIVAKNKNLSFLNLDQSSKNSNISILEILKGANADALRQLILNMAALGKSTMSNFAETINRFRHLQRFSIKIPNWNVKEEDIKLLTLNELNNLTLFNLENEEVILTVVKQFPNLTTLVVNSQNYPSPAMLQTLTNFLEEQDRYLKFQKTNEGYVLDF